MYHLCILVSTDFTVALYGRCDIDWNEECSDRNAECRDGICKCSYGYHAKYGICSKSTIPIILKFVICAII